MPYRVLIAGGAHLPKYSALRAILDTLLANRLPDVELLTVGGRGVPMLAASYAAERVLPITALLPEYGRFPDAAAEERRDAELLLLVDAAVVVWSHERDVQKLLEQIEAKGIPHHVISGPIEPLKLKRRFGWS